MFKIFLVVAIFLCVYTSSFPQSEHFRIFGIKLKARDIVGQKNFNEMDLKYFTKVINGLTEDSATYFWRLGRIRVNYKKYRDGTFNLFNLSNSHHPEGYPMLDSIDFTYYREWGFQILESRYPILKNDARYNQFRDSLSNAALSLLTRRAILWNDRYSDMRDKMLMTRFFVNSQVISLNRKILRKIGASINANVKSDINDLLKIGSKLEDTVTHKKVDSLQLAVYLNHVLDKTVDLRGNYITAGFQSSYLNELSTIINGVDSSDSIVNADANEFNRNLHDYIHGDGASWYATNTALFAFKFSGSIDKINNIRDSIASTLSALFNIASKQAASLAVTASLVYTKQVTETFKNQFSKIWVIKFGSDQKFEELHFYNRPKRVVK
jgi:hypothetical protein